MRESKFRAWNVQKNKMSQPFGIFDIHTDDESNRFGGSFELGFIGEKIMQFIGQKDKNGKEIYEGDFVKAPFDDLDEYKEIYFAKGIFGYGGYITPLSDFHSEDLEVIGNICKNPEMDKDDVNVLGAKNESRDIITRRL